MKTMAKLHEFVSPSEVAETCFPSISEKQKKEGRLAEESIEAYLNLQNYPFLLIEQSLEKCSIALKESGGKRPDYFVCINGCGPIIVDAKSRNLDKRFENFTLDEKDVQELLVLQNEMLHRPVWFAISCPENLHYTKYWITLNDVLKSPLRENTYDATYFRTINIKTCITIGWNDRLEKLFK